MRKLLTIIVLGLLFTGNAGLTENLKTEDRGTREYNWPKGDFTWRYINGMKSKNISTIWIKLEHMNSSRDAYLSRLIIFENCRKDNKREIKIIKIANQKIKRMEKKEIKIKGQWIKGENLCAGLKFQFSTFMPLEPPDYCINEKSFFGKKKCQIKEKITNIDFSSDKRFSKSEAANYCATNSGRKAKEVRKQYYKDCMDSEGY